MPPYAYLTQRRMHWAQQALQGGLSVTEVAMACGYANPSKFSAAFRRVVGVSPSTWSRH
ncbi:Virulence regulon transcriptional activator VirF [compost metagenome]